MNKVRERERKDTKLLNEYSYQRVKACVVMCNKSSISVKQENTN